MLTLAPGGFFDSFQDSSGGSIRLNISKGMADMELASGGGEVVVKAQVSQPLRLWLEAGKVDIDGEHKTHELISEVTAVNPEN